MTPYDQKTISHRFATLLIDHPIRSILTGLALLAVLIPGLAKMQADFSYRIWFRDSDPLLADFDAFERRFGNDEMVALIVHSDDGIFDQDSLKLVQQLTSEMEHIPEIIRVDSLTNYNWTHSEEDDLMVEPLIPGEEDLEEGETLTDELIAQRAKVALEHEVIPSYLVSPDGEAAVIYALLKPAIGGAPDFETVMVATRGMLSRFLDGGDITFVHEPEKYRGAGNHSVYVTGGAAISQSFKDITQSDMMVMVPALLTAIAIFLLISFRRISGVMMPFMVIVCSITATLGFAGWVGIEFNNMTSIVPHILIAISVADAVHILVTFFQFRRSGIERKESAHKTLVKNLQPTLLTSISTSIGFFSFSSAKIIPVVYMGVLAGTGTLIAWFVTILVLTPMMAYLPIKVSHKEEAVKHYEAHPLAIRYAEWLQGRSRLVAILFFGAIAVAGWAALQNEINSDPFKYFSKDVHTRVANEYAEDKIGGMMAFEITINSGETDGIKSPEWLRKVEAFDIWLQELDHITKTVSLLDIIKQTNRSLNGDDPAAYVIPDNRELIAQELFLYTMSLPQGMDLNNRMTLDNDMIRLSAMSSLHESRRSLIEIDRIEAKAVEMGLDARVTGKMPLYHNMNPYVVNAFIVSISMALFLVSILMVVSLKSWKLGMLSMIPNTVPLIFGGAFMWLLNKPLDIGTVLVASTCLGIAVDDTIHFLSNYNRWRKLGSSPAHAIAHVITHTGPALFVTTSVLVVAFGTFMFADFVPNVNFGIMTAIVLTTALVTDATLLPAILMWRKAEETETTTVGEVEAVAS